MSRRMGRSVVLAALATIGSFGGAGSAAGGELTATFTATPSSLEEGGSSDLKLSLHYAPAPQGTGQGTAYAGAYRYDYFNSGNGKLTAFSGTIDCGQGQTLDVSSPLDAVAHDVVERVVYDDPGVYTASISGSATAYDQRSADRYKLHPVRQIWMSNGFVSKYDRLAYVLPLDASVDVAVANVGPSITNVSWSPAATIDVPFSFAVTASDPGGAAPDETIVIEFDLDDDGEFDDYRVSGSFVASGTHVFDAEGTHVVRVRVTDGLGGSAEASFTVTVGNHPPAVSPLETADVEFDGALAEVEFSAVVSDDDGHPLSVAWSTRESGGSWTIRKVENLASGATASYRGEYPFGATSVRLEVFDGYDTTTVGATVNVRDTLVPIVGAAEDVRVPTDPGKAFATGVSLAQPTVEDASGRPVTLTNDAPTRFPLGETTVRWTATDASGNHANVEQKVIVEDREAPTIKGQRIVRLPVDPGRLVATAVPPVPTAFDNVSDPSKIAISRTTRSRFRVGRTVVVFRATDEAGNIAEFRTTVVVVNRRPVALAGADVVVTTTNERGVRVKLDGSRSTDLDRHALKFHWRSPKAKLSSATAIRPSAIFPVGTSRVRLIVTDPAGARDADLVTVTVKLKNAGARPRGASANAAFAQASRAAEQAVVSRTSGAAAAEGLAYATVADRLGDAAGEYVRWEEGGSATDAWFAYAEVRMLQRGYGAAAAKAFLSAYAQTGDESLLDAYRYAVLGTVDAQADLNE